MSIATRIGKAVSTLTPKGIRDVNKDKKLTPSQMREPNKWHLRSLPPEDDPDVGGFFYKLFEEALRERDRLGIPERWHENYKLFRGDHWQGILKSVTKKVNRGKLSLALLQANVTRTVANITARAPLAEVSTADGIEDGTDRILSEKLRMWNSREEQQETLERSVINQEVYGITIEKAVWDANHQQGRSVVCDPFSFIPAPGNYERLNDAPYLIHMFAMNIEEAEAKYDVSGITEDSEVSTILGEEREDQRIPTGTTVGSANASGNFTPTHHPTRADDMRIRRALVVEVWIRDYSTETRYTTKQYMDPETGEMLTKVVEEESPKYPGGIRVVTFCNYGNVVLADQKNPNVNHALPLKAVEKTHLFKNFPFYHANSYKDTNSLYGYAMAETCGDINLAIDDLWSTITAYTRMSMFPPLILPQDTKISKAKIQYLPRLVLQPVSGTTGDHIRWLEMPAPPQWLFNSLNTLVSFFDRISQIEDADRGEAPGSVTAASAIQMMQERGAVLIRAKIRAVDYLVRERGRCFISFFQNFGVTPEIVTTQEGPEEVMGISLIQRNFNYIVESGSTVAKTSSQVRQEALELFKLQAIDRQALLKQINFPDWRNIVERMGESQLQAALGVLVQSGLPEDVARELYNTLIQDQGGPGDASESNGQSGGIGKAGAPAEAGTPKALQGQEQEAN